LLQTKKNKKQIATKPKGKATTSMWGSTFHSTENYPLSKKNKKGKCAWTAAKKLLLPPFLLLWLTTYFVRQRPLACEKFFFGKILFPRPVAFNLCT